MDEIEGMRDKYERENEMREKQEREIEMKENEKRGRGWERSKRENGWNRKSWWERKWKREIVPTFFYEFLISVNNMFPIVSNMILSYKEGFLY